MATNHEADRIAEATDTIHSMITQAIIKRTGEAKRNARKYANDPEQNASSRAWASIRAELNEHDENFELLLNIVSAKAQSGSVDCESVLTQFIEDYKNSF